MIDPFDDTLKKLSLIDQHPKRLLRWLMEGYNARKHTSADDSDISLRHFIENAADRLRQHEPLSKILEEKEFYGRSFKTTHATLDPRPETELIIQQALNYFSDRDHPYRFLDLGTGTGCILITLLKEFHLATGVAVDCSKDAIDVAHFNATNHNVENRITCIESDWLKNVSGSFDGIFSNPPYIKDDYPLHPSVSLYDPQQALFGGADGLDAYRAIFQTIHRVCTPHTHLFFEIGFDQGRSVPLLVKQYGLKVLDVIVDYSDHPRLVVCIP
jgi:release factor glutamine methyltransferase